MKWPWKISLYYKLFLVFGLTFIGVVRVLGDSLQRPFDPDDAQIIGIQLATCVFLLVLNSLAVRRLLKPLKEVTKFSKEFSEGKLGARIQRRTNDEIGELATSFNSMAERIQVQMESLKHMAVGVSHEIRTPLTRMRVAVEMSSDQNSKEILAEQIREIDAITGSILEREALDSGISELKLGKVDMGEMLKDLGDHYRNSGEQINVKPSEIIVSGDRRRLEMCFKNLLDNCFKHGQSDHPVEVSVGEAGNSIFVQIVDQGGGISERPSSGFGLGLKLAASIAKAHGGDLKFENRESLGTSVTVTLPK